VEKEKKGKKGEKWRKWQGKGRMMFSIERTPNSAVQNCFLDLE